MPGQVIELGPLAFWLSVYQLDESKRSEVQPTTQARMVLAKSKQKDSYIATKSKIIFLKTRGHQINVLTRPDHRRSLRAQSARVLIRFKYIINTRKSVVTQLKAFYFEL